MPKSIYKLSPKDLAPDILLLLTLRNEGRLQEAVVRQVIKGACWWIANSQGRRDACDLWSKEARRLRKTSKTWDGLGLVHEHIVPRSVIEEEIITLDDPTLERIEELLRLSRVCVVTRDEDRRLREANLGARLPSGSSISEGGALRYQLVGIEVEEVTDADEV